VSVAFRRESDEEHKEPRFEIPIPVGPNLVTRRGLEQTEKRVAELQALVATEQDPMLLEQAKRDLRYWNTRLATAELTIPADTEEVGFGCRVTFKLRGAVRSIDIVGDDEAEPANGRIAFSAPLARAMAGAAPGDFADFGGESDAIEVLEVAPIDC
jgi:transcription elongation GreA/GreB family factor